MQLRIKEVTPADIEAAKSIYGPETGDLCAAAVGVSWPSDSSNIDLCKQRAEWSCQQQREVLENDPTTKFIMVVDADKNDEMIAFGRWHRYLNGYQHMPDLEAVGVKDRNTPATFPEGFHKDFYLGFLDDLLAARTDWMGRDHYWVLTNVATREPLRRQGAASMILEWGLDQAAKEGVPAYLEAVVQAMGLYQKHGFREIGRQKVDCTPYGMPGVQFEIARMKADPK